MTFTNLFYKINAKKLKKCRRNNTRKNIKSFSNFQIFKNSKRSSRFIKFGDSKRIYLLMKIIKNMFIFISNLDLRVVD